MIPRTTGMTALVLAALLSLFIVASATQAAPDKKAGKRPAGVKSASDGAKSKLHPDLQQQVESGSTDTVRVFATTDGDAAPAAALLDDAKVASSAGAALVVGKIGVQALPKLASARGVVAVSPIELKQTGQPLGGRDPEVGKNLDAKAKNKALHKLYDREVPFAKAPAPKGSNFEALKSLGVLDAKTHNFAEAWNAGYAGEGVTVGVLDGGTDFGHPDLLGTWQTWSGLTASRAGWNGWPKAFDPYGTLVWLVAPDLVDQGLTWYTATEAATCPDWPRKSAKASCHVEFATKTGPARNFNAPTGTNQHNYKFPAGVDEVGQRPARQPSRRPPAGALRRAAGVPRHRREHGRRLRHGLRRPRRRLSLRRREARDEGLAGVVPRHGRRRLHRHLRRPPLLHLGRLDEASGRRGRLRPRAGLRARRDAGVDRRLRPGDRGPRNGNGVQHRRPGGHQRPGADVQRRRGRDVSRAPSSAAHQRRSSRRTATSTSRSSSRRSSATSSQRIRRAVST